MRTAFSVIVATLLSLAASAALAAPLVNPSVTLSNTGLSQSTAITARHTTASPVNANSFIMRFALPFGFGTSLSANQFNCTGVTLKIDNVIQPPAGFDPCGLTTSGLVYVRAPALVPAGSVVEVEIDSGIYITSATPGVHTFSLFETADGGGHEIDGAVPRPTVTLAAPPPPVPTLTEWAMILFGAALAGVAALTIHRRRQMA